MKSKEERNVKKIIGLLQSLLNVKCADLNYYWNVCRRPSEKTSIVVELDDFSQDGTLSKPRKNERCRL